MNLSAVVPRSPVRSLHLHHPSITEFLQQSQQLLPVALQPSIVIVPLEEALRGGLLILREEEVVAVGLLLESECVDELVVFLEVLVVAEEEDDLVDVLLGADG